MNNIKERKKIKLKQRTKQNGITLIALIVTIIVLLILAGVTVATLNDDNGIIEKAQEAKNKTDEQSMQEQLDLLEIQKEMNKDTDEDADETDDFLNIVKDKNNITQKEIDNYNKILEKEGKKIIPIPSFEELDKIGKDKEYPLDGLYVQTKDIDFKNTNILDPINNFSGVYNGNDKTISNLQLNISKENAGIFGTNTGNIKNLTIDDYNVTSEYSCTGIIVGSNKGLIKNCVTKEGNLECNGNNDGSRLGGICGINETNGRIKNCTNYSTVIGNNKLVGGICGYNLGGNIENCNNNGNIQGLFQVGGIVGDSEGLDENNIVYVRNCENSGNIIKINVSGHDENESFGGIAGCNFEYSILEDNKNSGTIEGAGKGTGGIAGSNYYLIQRCVNYGNIKNTNQDVNAWAGGIVGVSRGKIYSCNNQANVEIDSSSGGFAGGIVGVIGNNELGAEDKIVERCYNIGQVSGNKYIGGIAGRASVDASINSSYNIGNVSGNSYVGGITGDTVGDTISIKNSYNKGEVSAINSYAGGITGAIRCEVENVYNTGKVTISSSSDRIGALFGVLDANYISTTEIKNCYYLDSTYDRPNGNESTVGNISGAIKKTSEEMQKISNLLGSEFKQNTEGDKYPKLKWE